MIFRRSTVLLLRPFFTDNPPPFLAILKQWMKEGFEPQACRAALENLIRTHKQDPNLFDLNAIEQGGLVMKEEALYPKLKTRLMTLISHADEQNPRVLHKPLSRDELKVFADFVDAAAHDDEVAFQDYGRQLGIDAGMLEQISSGAEPPAAQWDAADTPGVYRREHASLLIRSQTTSVLVDPLGLNAEYPYMSESPLNTGTEKLDAICITHGHADHWHLPSIFSYARRANIPVIVPRVPEVSLLTLEDFEQTLQLIGQNVLAPEWGSVVKIGDIEIDILPFYGEQPTREAPGPAPLIRNWGNCYRFNTPEFSALALVDSGADPLGDMVEVARASAAKRGPADMILSSIREFPSPFFGGIATDWATLPFSRLQQLFDLYQANKLPPTTIGIKGLTELCDAAKAKYYLSYANGFAGIGQSIEDVGWGMGEPAELERLQTLETALSSRGVTTAVRDWNPGDSAHLAEGKLTLRRYAGASA